MDIRDVILADEDDETGFLRVVYPGLTVYRPITSTALRTP